MSEAVIQVKNVNKSFHVGAGDVPILKDINFEVTLSDFMIIFGPSGCGKSTLLHTILGLEEPSSGTITILGQDVYDGITEDKRSEFRKKHIGMIYQQPNWIRSLTVLENVAFPLSLLGIEKGQRTTAAFSMLEKVNMVNWAGYIPTELSSGQQQKVALARALITDPEIIIADEPTGNLDFESGQELMQILTKLNTEQNKTVVMVTHDLEYIKYAKNTIRMIDGKIVNEYKNNEKDKLLKEVKMKRSIV
jgi:ABC-type lipoprotein export system ATPase subunit